MPDLIDRNKVLEVIFNIMSDNKIVHKHRALNRNIKQIPKANTEMDYKDWTAGMDSSQREVFPKDVSDDGVSRYLCPECQKLTYQYRPSCCKSCGVKFKYEELSD